MKIEFDSDKNKANIAKHGVGAKTWLDTRQNYGEDRTVALGFIAAPPACSRFHDARTDSAGYQPAESEP